MDNEIKNQYVLIGGTGRSGTNITRHILSNHSQVASFPFEYRFIIDPDGIIDFYNSFSTTWSPFNSDVKIKRLNNFLLNLANKNAGDKNYAEWELAEWLPNYVENVEELISSLKSFEYSGFWPGARSDSNQYSIWFSENFSKQQLCNVLGKFVKKNIDQYLIEKRKDIFVEDNTWNILFLREILDLIPEVKFLHIIRDPRDVIASFINQRWCPNSIQEAIIMYKSIINRYFNIENSIPQNCIKLVKLEDLVANSEQVAKEICEFIQIPFEPSMTKVNLTRSNQGRWKNDFSIQDIQLLEDSLNSLILKLGYET